jgi:hypothetical protein
VSALEIIERRMVSGEPFTYGELCRLPGLGRDDDRLADKTIQRWRRKGWISFIRFDRSPLWSLTDAGRTMLAAAQEPPDDQ